MATLISARERIRAAAGHAGWTRRVTTRPDRDRFDSPERDSRTGRGHRVLTVWYNDRDGISHASLQTGSYLSSVGGGAQRLQRIVDALHTTEPTVSGPQTWGGARCPDCTAPQTEHLPWCREATLERRKM